MLLGDFAKWHGIAYAGARVQDVDLALFPLNGFEQAVEIVEIGCVAAPAGHVAADQLDGLVELFLLPARYKNVCAFFNEPLGALQRHAARSTRDDCDLTFELTHDLSFVLRVDAREHSRRHRHGFGAAGGSVQKKAHRWCGNHPVSASTMG